MFTIIGDEIHFSGYKVATLCEKGCPPSVREEVEHIISRIERYENGTRNWEAGYAAAQRALRADYKRKEVE